MGKTFRSHSVDYVVDHIDYVVNKYKVKTVFFEDDNLTLDTKRFEAICDRIIERGIRVNWETPNGVRADCLNPRILKKMKASGCQSVFIGIESGDQYVLDKVIEKELDLRKVMEVARDCKNIGLKTGAFYIIGFPGEKKKNMLKTIDFALMLRKQFDVGMHLFFATPSLGTRLYDECKQKNYIKKNLDSRSFAEARQAQGMPLIETEDFTVAELKELASSAVRKYRRLSLLCHLRNPGRTLKTAISQPSIVLKFVKSLYHN
jgi:magnesium-protoporphyrin IX monomethyl ester (oxidative) cyclase